MPFASSRFGFAYFPIPKVAGTSIRSALFTLETGRPFVPGILPSGAPTELWMHFPAVALRDVPRGTFDRFDRVVVVRHPLERLVSAYRNRVRHYGEIETADFARAGIDPSVPKDPDFDAFCRHLPAYRRIASIRHHTEPQALYLGPDLSWFDRVFSLERIRDFEDYLSGRAGAEVILSRLRNDGPPRGDVAISEVSRRAVSAHYAADFRLLARIYGPGRLGALSAD